MPNGTGTVLVPSPMPVDFPAPTVDSTTGNKKVYVKPPVIHVGKGASQLRDIQFSNHTGGRATLWFLPDGLPLFDADKYPTFENPLVIEDGKTGDLKLKPNLGDGIYEYHVRCDALAGGEADGNSPPSLSCP